MRIFCSFLLTYCLKSGCLDIRFRKVGIKARDSGKILHNLLSGKSSQPTGVFSVEGEEEC